jgi:hypothetical protein
MGDRRDLMDESDRLKRISLMIAAIEKSVYGYVCGL